MPFKKSRLKNSLKVSLTEGVFASIMLGLTENFWVASAEAIQVSALKAGLVSTFPLALSSIAQTAAGNLTERLGGRLKTLKKIIVVQWISLIPLILLPLYPEKLRYFILLTCAVLFAVGGTLPGPAWLSLMSDHLPRKSKGKYFGWRNRTLGMVALVSGLLAGQILQYFKKNVLIGFAVLFGTAFVSRVVSWSFLIRMIEPRKIREDFSNHQGLSDFPNSFLEFITSFNKFDFVRFSFFVACLNLSVNITAPYLAVYLIRDLHYSYTHFSYVIFSATLTTIFGVKIWGELADKFGNLRVIRATSIFIAVIPLLWFFSGDPLWLVFVQVAAGFAWSGFQLNVMTFAFFEVPTYARTHAIGYFSALNGTAIFVGSCFGGVLLKFLPTMGRSPFLGLFLISAFMRVLTLLYFQNRLKEKRSVLPISTFDLYADALGLVPILQSGKEIYEIVLRRKKP